MTMTVQEVLTRSAELTTLSKEARELQAIRDALESGNDRQIMQLVNQLSVESIRRGLMLAYNRKGAALAVKDVTSPSYSTRDIFALDNVGILPPVSGGGDTGGGNIGGDGSTGGGDLGLPTAVLTQPGLVLLDNCQAMLDGKVNSSLIILTDQMSITVREGKWTW